MAQPSKPILADYFYQFILRSEKIYKLSDAESGALKEVLAKANRFVFPARTTDMAEEAVKLPRKLAPFLTLPSKWTWIEFVNPTEGVLLNGSDDLKRANAIFIYKGSAGAKGDMVSIANAPVDLMKGGFQLGEKPDAIPERFQRRFMGAITLLGAPDLLERKRVEHSRKWNESRLAKGELGRISHDVIELHLTRYEKEQEHEWYEQRHKHEGTGGRKRYHFVRAHIRIYQDGKVTKVSPHYRGDASLGIAPTTHIVRP